MAQGTEAEHTLTLPCLVLGRWASGALGWRLCLCLCPGGMPSPRVAALLRSTPHTRPQNHPQSRLFQEALQAPGSRQSTASCSLHGLPLGRNPVGVPGPAQGQGAGVVGVLAPSEEPPLRGGTCDGETRAEVSKVSLQQAGRWAAPHCLQMPLSPTQCAVGLEARPPGLPWGS